MNAAGGGPDLSPDVRNTGRPRLSPLLPEIPEEFLREEFYRPASGPGGQHVNRTETGVRLRFFFRACPVLSEEWKNRLARAAGAGPDDESLVILSRRSRSLRQNREEAFRRLRQLLEQTRRAPAVRRPTKPTKASKERRLASKSRRSALKRSRSSVQDEG